MAGRPCMHRPGWRTVVGERPAAIVALVILVCPMMWSVLEAADGVRPTCCSSWRTTCVRNWHRTVRWHERRISVDWPSGPCSSIAPTVSRPCATRRGRRCSPASGRIRSASGTTAPIFASRIPTCRRCPDGSRGRATRPAASARSSTTGTRRCGVIVARGVPTSFCITPITATTVRSCRASCRPTPPRRSMGSATRRRGSASAATCRTTPTTTVASRPRRSACSTR